MNLQQIDLWQNGRKVCTFQADKETFDSITDNVTASKAASMNNAAWHFPDFLGFVITVVVLSDCDEDGHREIEETKLVVPEWNEYQTALLRQGYLLAMQQIHNEVFVIDSDVHKIEELHAMFRACQTSCEEDSPIELKPNIRI